MERISVKEYARLNHISYYMVRKLIVNGQLDYVKFGRIYRISINAVPREPEPKYTKMTSEEYLAKLKSILK